MSKIDPVHQQRQRELMVGLLRAYGVTKNLDQLDNRALLVELEKALCGIK